VDGGAVNGLRNERNGLLYEASEPHRIYLILNIGQFIFFFSHAAALDWGKKALRR
jgi:hypothetical protein